MIPCVEELERQLSEAKSRASQTTVKQFCDTHCAECPYQDCEVSFDPSCKLSRELNVRLEPEA